MNIQNLKVGQVVKNYKAMCEILGEDVKVGNSRKYQIVNWERFIKYEKSGQKFMIIEIYENPSAKKSRGGSNNVKYSDLLDALILDLLAQSDGVLSIGKTKLMELVGMVNFNYSIGKNYMNSLSKSINTDVKVVRDFYNSNESNLSNAIEVSMKRLSARGLLKYDYTYMIKSSDDNSYRLATNKDISIIAMIESRILKNFGMNSKNDVVRNGRWLDFKKSMSNGLSVVSDIDYYFRAYKIISNKVDVVNAKNDILADILDSDTRKKFINDINDRVINSNEENALKRSEKYDDSKSYRGKSKYVDDIMSIAHILISKNNNIDIRSLISSGEVLSDKVISDEEMKNIMDAIDNLF